MTTITFYKYTGERNRLSKDVSNGTDFQCNFNRTYDIIHPVLDIATDTFDYNYCFIPDTRKYYFIDNINEYRSGFFRVSLTEDVLMSYKDKILTLYGTVTQSINNKYMQGANIPSFVQTKLKEYDFENPFDETGSYILIGVGYVANE